jgi:hypothetical protein
VYELNFFVTLVQQMSALVFFVATNVLLLRFGTTEWTQVAFSTVTPPPRILVW